MTRSSPAATRSQRASGDRAPGRTRARPTIAIGLNCKAPSSGEMPGRGPGVLRRLPVGPAGQLRAGHAWKPVVRDALELGHQLARGVQQRVVARHVLAHVTPHQHGRMVIHGTLAVDAQGLVAGGKACTADDPLDPDSPSWSTPSTTAGSDHHASWRQLSAVRPWRPPHRRETPHRHRGSPESRDRGTPPGRRRRRGRPTSPTRRPGHGVRSRRVVLHAHRGRVAGAAVHQLTARVAPWPFELARVDDEVGATLVEQVVRTPRLTSRPRNSLTWRSGRTACAARTSHSPAMAMGTTTTPFTR